MDNLAFLHDESAVAGWHDSVSGNSWNFLQISGTTLAGAYTTSAGTTTWVPLIDAQGSTIGLVNPVSPGSPPATTYTYDPSGMPSMSGQPSIYPFLYEGMENEFTDQAAALLLGQGMLYTGDGQFYSAQIARSLSLIGALGTNSPGGPGPSRAHHGHSGGGGGGAGRGAAISGHTNIPAVAIDYGGGGDYSVSSDSGASTSLLGLIFEGILEAFGIGGGSSGPPPPNYYVFQARLDRAGRHPLYDQIDGSAKDIVLDQKSAHRVRLSQLAQISTATGHQAVQTVQDIVPVEPTPPLQVPGTFDLDPDSPAWGFSPRGITYSRCLDAAEHPAIWADLCKDMPSNSLKEGCWALLPKSVQMKRGFCADLFET